jgi:hypothetical protein
VPDVPRGAGRRERLATLALDVAIVVFCVATLVMGARVVVTFVTWGILVLMLVSEGALLWVSFMRRRLDARPALLPDSRAVSQGTPEAGERQPAELQRAMQSAGIKNWIGASVVVVFGAVLAVTVEPFTFGVVFALVGVRSFLSSRFLIKRASEVAARQQQQGA